MGLKEDLNIEKGTKYNTALTIFFVPYIIFEIPSNILLKKFKPHLWCTLFYPFLDLCMTVRADSNSVILHVWFRSCHDLSGLGVQLGWFDDHSVVLRYSRIALVAWRYVLIRAQECLRPVYSPDVRCGLDRFLMSRKPDELT